MDTADDLISRAFGERCDDARAKLRMHMSELGLHPEDGWLIHESTRNVGGRTEIVMRPLHRRLSPPTGLECLCAIDEPGEEVSSECRE